MLYFNKTRKPCDINPAVPDVNNAEKRGILTVCNLNSSPVAVRGILGQDFVLNEIDIDDDSDYAGDEENVFASKNCDSLTGEFLIELGRSLMLQLQPLAL